MKAMVIHEHGERDKLELMLDCPEPAVGPGQVRVRVKACALNHLDLWVRRGLPHLRLTYPHILGADIAGEVEAVGAGVTGPRPGEKVVLVPGVSCGVCPRCLAGQDNLCRSYGILGETRDGGYAELVTVPAANLLPCPESLGFAEAASLPLTFQTAWQMVVAKGQVRPGDLVLVLAAGSGVGSAAVQIAKLHGAEVIATASSGEKLARARDLGADHLVNHGDPDWDRQVRAISKPGPALIIEHVGTATWERSIKLCQSGGRIVTCGATTGWDAHTDLRHVFFRQISILGSTMGTKAMLHDVMRHVASGKLRPVVDRVLPLEQAAEAHRLLEQREVFGKVVLTI